MRRVIITTFVSADGVMEAPENWMPSFWSEEAEAYKREEVLASDALLLGRATYLELSAAWPEMTDPLGFADQMNRITKYVISSTLTDLPWNNSRLLGENLDGVSQLKAEPGKDMLVVGSASLVNGLVQRGLVDEFRLMTFPVIAGTGKRLFNGGNPQTPLELIETKPLPNGVTVLTYRPTTSLPAGKLPHGWQ